MSREEQLVFCTVCIKRKFRSDKGVVCGLTNEWASFNEECSDYEPDQAMINRRERMAFERAERELSDKTVGLSKYGIKNQFLAGLILFAIGFIWLIVGLVQFNLLFLYAFIIMVVGLVLIAMSLMKEVKKRKAAIEEKRSSDILDAKEK